MELEWFLHDGFSTKITHEPDLDPDLELRGVGGGGGGLS